MMVHSIILYNEELNQYYTTNEKYNHSVLIDCIDDDDIIEIEHRDIEALNNDRY